MRKRRIVKAAAVVAILGAGAAFFLFRNDASDAAPDRVKPKTAVIGRDRIVVTVAATGIIEPAFKVDVKSKASGEITSFPLEAGDIVKAREIICELDPTDEARNVQLREAEVATNAAAVKGAAASLEVMKVQAARATREADGQVLGGRAELAVATEKLARAQTLLEQKLASPENVDDARVAWAAATARLTLAEAAFDAAKAGVHQIEERGHQVDIARATLSRSQISLEEAKKRLAETKVVAPIDGIILTKAVEKGHIIASGITSVSGGTSIATLADMSRVFVMAEVDESDIGRVVKGLPVEITVDAYREERFEGQVHRRLPLGIERSNVTVFQVKIEVLSPNKAMLLANMTCNVQIEVDGRKDCIAVPNAAMKTRDGAIGVEVFAGEGKPAAFRKIERGLTDGLRTEVLGGLEEGEVVILGDAEPPPGAGGSFIGRMFRGRRTR